MIGALSLLVGMAFGQTVVVEEGEQMEEVLVEFQADRDTLTVGMVTGRSTGQVGGYTVSAVGSKALCVAPCTVRLAPGFYEFYATGSGRYVRTEQVQLTDAKTILYGESGSSAGRVIANNGLYLGLAAIVGGITMAALDPGNKLGLQVPGIATAAGGVALTGGSTGLIIATKSAWRKQ